MVAPVRWATPGTDVVWAHHLACSAMSTIQSARTPPPWPPMARMAILMGEPLWNVMLVMAGLLERILTQTLAAARLQQADDALAHLGLEQIPLGWIVDEVGPVERRAQHGGVRDLAAVAAADAGVVDVGDGVFFEGVAAVLDGERRAAREPDTGMVAGADVRVDAEALFDHPLAFLDRRAELRLDAPLLVQHAFGLRNDDLGPFLGCGQGFFDGGLHLGDAVGAVQYAHPFDTHALDGVDDGV